MLLFRLLGLLVAVALGSLVLTYLLSGERKYLHYAWRLFRYSLFLAVFVLILIFGERLTDQF